VGVTSNYLLPQRATNAVVSIYLNDDNFKPEVKIGTPSGYTLINEMQWIILTTINSDVTKIQLHELGDTQERLSMNGGRHFHITSGITQVNLSKKNGHIWWTWQVLAYTDKWSNRAGRKMNL